MAQCSLQRTDAGWWCPNCDPDQAHLLPVRAYRVCGKYPDPPTLAELIETRHAVREATITPEESERRRQICVGCEHHVAADYEHRCRKTNAPGCAAAWCLLLLLTTDERRCPEDRFKLLHSPETASPAGQR